MTSLDNRLVRLEHDLGLDVDGGPSLILLTALGRDADDIRSIRLGDGRELHRLDAETAADFRERAVTWAAAAGPATVKLATAQYRDGQATEALA